MGRELAQQLARDIPSFEALYNMSEEELTMMDRIGKTKAEVSSLISWANYQGIYKFLHSSENRKMLFVLNEILPAMSGPDKGEKRQTDQESKNTQAKSDYAGKIFVFTGTMSGIDRDRV